MRRMLEALAGLQRAAEPDAPGHGAARPARRSWLPPRAAGVAAVLLLGVLLGFLLAWPFDAPGPQMQARAVAFDAPGVHRVTLAFDSPHALGPVEFVVELPPGVELVGFPGQRRVRWEGRLAEGRSRLDLPLRIEARAELGRLVARVVHESGERTLEVPLELRGRGDAEDRA
jgi:hypothetical protein